MLSSCVTPAYMNALEIMALTELPADKDHDKYQYIIVTYSDEILIKHPYLNIDDETLTFNQ